MGGTGAGDLGRVLDGLHQRDRGAPARDLAPRLGDDLGERIGSGCLIEAHDALCRTERREILSENGRLAHIRQLLERVAHGIGQLAAVDIESGTPLLRHDREGERQRRVRHVGAADVEGPGDVLRIGDDERVGLELGDLGADAGKLRGRILAGKARIVRRHRAERRGRAIGPDRVDRIGLGRHQRRVGGGASLGKPLGGFDRVQPGIVAEVRAGREIGFEPRLRRCVDQVLDREGVGIDLIAYLQRIAAVDEDRRAVGKHDRHPGRAVEAGEPGEALLRWREIFALEPVGTRHDETGESATRELAAQRGDARYARRCRRGVFEGLKMGLEHGRQSMGGGQGGQPRRAATQLPMRGLIVVRCKNGGTAGSTP